MCSWRRGPADSGVSDHVSSSGTGGCVESQRDLMNSGRRRRSSGPVGTVARLIRGT